MYLEFFTRGGSSMNKKITKGLLLTFACLLGVGGLLGAIHASKNAETQEVKAAVTNIYSHTFASGDFRTDRWWGVDGDVFWGDAISSIESDGGTFTASEYLWRFVYENSSKVEIDNIYIPVHFTGDVTVKVMDDETSKQLLQQSYHSGDNAIVITDLNTTSNRIAVNVNRTSGSANSTTRILYGETVVISRTSSFKITFNANGGSGGPSPVDAEQGVAMPTISTFPTKTGYTFAGYYDATSGGTKYYNANGSSARNWDKAADTVLYAHWTANNYTVKYNANKPSNASANVTGVPANQNATYDVNLTLGSAPSLTGWTFDGWYKESACTNKAGNAGASVKNLATSGTANLYAKWVANTYTVKYNANTPSAATSSVTGMPGNATWTYDSNATLGSAPSLTGWTFGGWYKEAACTNKVGNGGQALTKPNLTSTKGATVNLFAKWTQNTYTVNYNGNKPSKAPSSFNVTDIPADAVWTYDANATLGSAPKLTGYVFDGWYKEIACSNKVGNANQALTKPNLSAINGSTVKLYAKWVFDPAIQAVVDDINETKTVSYDELTSQISIAETGYNGLSSDFKAVVQSEGYKAILDNAKAADEVGQMIEDLGPAQDTPEWRQAVSEAREAYDALVDKSFIPTETILKILVDDEAAVIVMNSINAIGDPHWTSASKALIDAAQSAYDAYIDAGHPSGQIANYQTLVNAHTDYNNVQSFVDKVNAITDNPFEYTPECKALIDAARSYYEDDLSTYQKGLATSDAAYYYNLLVNYENAYNAMHLIDLIEDMENTPECGEKIAAARAAVEDLDPTSEMPLMNTDLLKELDDKEAGWGVIVLVNAIYPMVYGENCENAIKEARDAYSALADDQEQYVVNYDMLLKAEEDYAAVKAVVEEISNLGDIRHDEESLAKIQHVRESYEALTEDQKQLYPDSYLQDIIDYETAYEALDKIYAVGEVGYDHESEGRIKDARDFYDSLTDKQKELINGDDYVVLLTAETNYADAEKTATIWLIVLFVLVGLLILGGIFFIIFLLKRREDDDDENGENQNGGSKKMVKAASFGGILPFIFLVSHWVDGQFITLYVLAGVAILLWIAVLVIVILKKKGVIASKSVMASTATSVSSSSSYNGMPLMGSAEEVTYTDEKGNIFQIRFIKSFTAKLIQSSDETKKYYEELKNEVMSYKEVNSRVSWHYDSVTSSRNPVVKFAIRGKTLCVYFPLNADEYTDSKYKVEKSESKKFEDTPCMYRIKNDRRVGYAKELIAKVCESLGLKKGEAKHDSYVLPFEENKPLIDRGLIKEQKIQVKKSEESVVLESKVNADGDEIIVKKDASGNVFEIRFIKSFLAKLSQASDEVKDYYNALKNYALSYKGLSARVSWHYDSLNYGREQVLKFAIRGKTLCVYFALDSEALDPKYKVEKVESKKFSEVPCLYRIKNDRRFAYAKELIDLLMGKLGVKQGKEPNDDYRLPYEETKVLLAKGLIKEVKSSVKEKRSVKHVSKVSAEEADSLMSDEVAENLIEEDKNSKVHTGKKGIINLDDLEKNFSDGDTITLEALIEKKLVAKDVGRVKLLARGTLDKKFHVDLQDYSLQAVKMVLLVGGTVQKAK